MELKENKDAILYMWYRTSSALDKYLSRIKTLPKWAPQEYSTLEEFHQAYKDRLDFEFKTIRNMGFCSYFLIVSDGIEYCRKTGIPVGPGRGSAAGCLCAFLLRITKVDPIRYGLLFERFLNPERVSMPDIDVDYSQEFRHLVKEYFATTYGEDKVASIGTFSRMKVRAAIKDVARSLDLGKGASKSYQLADVIAKTLEDEDADITFEHALENDQFRSFMEEFPELATRIQQYENILRQMSMHAAGVLISSTRFDDSLPMMVDKKGMVLTAYDGNTVEKLGYLKLDTLGLKNLDIIESCKTNVEKVRKASVDKMSLSGIDFNPGISNAELRAKIKSLPPGALKRASKTYQLLREGKTLGIFQCEMGVTAHLLKQGQVNSIADIADILALIRPGPRRAGSTDVYLSRKRLEEEISYSYPFFNEDETLPLGLQEVLEFGNKEEIDRQIHELDNYLDTITNGLEPAAENKRWGDDLNKDPDIFKAALKIIAWKAKLANPDRFDYDLSFLSPICNETQGLPLFQEQLMKIATRCAGFTRGESDTLRKAVGKKDTKLIKKVERDFVIGMQRGSELIPNGTTKEVAQFLWYKFILPYGSYGFNKSHSIAYALISYETAFLKANYPGEFYAALLSHEKDQKKINIIIAEAKSRGIKFLPPNVNKSTEKFELVDERTIVYALTLMKGVGAKAVKKIVDQRPFIDMVDFIGRANCNASTTKTLIKGGAFDCAFTQEKINRKNYYDFFEDCRKKLRRQIDRLLKEALLKQFNLSPPKYSKVEKQSAETDGTYTTPTKWFNDLLETDKAFRAAWDEGTEREINEFQYNWSAPVTISRKGVAQAVPRESADSRSKWSIEELFEFEDEIYGSVISGHRLDPYRRFEETFDRNIESNGLAKYSIAESLDRFEPASEVFMFVQISELVSKKPYKKDPKQFTRRFTMEDRTGKSYLTVFERNYQDLFDKYTKYTPFSIFDRQLKFRPVLILKCKVNEWAGRKNLTLTEVVDWVNKEEIMFRINEKIKKELQTEELFEEEVANA